MGNAGMLYFASVDSNDLAEKLTEWQLSSPHSGVLALLPEAEKDSIPRLQALCAEHDIALAGGLFPSLIYNNQFVITGVWLLLLDPMPYYALYENLHPGAESATQSALKMAGDVRAHLNGSKQSATLFILIDALVPNVSTLLDELYLQLANRVHYAGANAGSETFKPMPCLFDSHRIINNGALLMLLTPHHGAVLEHGYPIPPEAMTATSTEGNRIVQIDWRPAFEVYRELAKTRFNVEITHENFYQYGVHFPFGIVRANHNVIVRIPVSLGEDGSLFCIGEVPANSVLVVLNAPTVDSSLMLDSVTKGLSDLNNGSNNKEVLLFYCAGRRLHLGMETATYELGEFSRRSEAKQVAGALSLGEIGGSTLWDYPLFHNAALCASLWQDQSN
jgi:hypothetical protein